MLRAFQVLALCGVLLAASCGYHGVNQASHIPAGVHSVYVPIFVNHTQLSRLELWMTNAVVHELGNRTQLQIEQKAGEGADATLRGTILTETVTPLTYSSNATTTTTSSYVIVVTAKLVLTDSQQRVLWENDNYSFREVYQSTQQLSSFIQEDSPALERLSREFASAAVSDMLESF